MKSGLAEQYKDGITSTSTVHTTEYIDHFIKKAIEIWVNMENFNIDVCCTLSKACCHLPKMLCSQKSTRPGLVG